MSPNCKWSTILKPTEISTENSESIKISILVIILNIQKQTKHLYTHLKATVKNEIYDERLSHSPPDLQSLVQFKDVF